MTRRACPNCDGPGRVTVDLVCPACGRDFGVTRPDLTGDVNRLAAERVARLRHRKRIRTLHQIARAIGVRRRNAAKLTRIKRIAARAGDAGCECSHGDVRFGTHGRWLHRPRCSGLDSYGLICTCPGFVERGES